jgi:hypothetical protein
MGWARNSLLLAVLLMIGCSDPKSRTDRTVISKVPASGAQHQFVPTAIVPATLEILKVDPNPIVVNGAFTLVGRVANLTDHALNVRVSSPVGATVRTFTLSPRGSQVFEIPGHLATVGTQDIQLNGQWQTDQKIFKLVGPTGPMIVDFVWAQIASATAPETVYAPLFPPAAPRISDIGPSGQSIGLPGGDSPSGVVGPLAGSSGFLYAASMTSGIWRQTQSGFWTQLPNGPPHAADVDADPTNPMHLVAVERADDKQLTNTLAGQAGAWETLDGGNSWTRIYDPGVDPEVINRSLSGGLTGVRFAPYGKAIIIAGPSGIGVQRLDVSGHNDPFVFPDEAKGDIRELAVSPNAVWALTSGNEVLLWKQTPQQWRDMGSITNAAHPWAKWQRFDMNGQSVTVTMADPNDTTSVSNVPVVLSHPQGLAAFDDRAYFAMNPVVAPTHPKANLDTNCTGTTPATYCTTFRDIFHNRLGLLTLDLRSGSAVWRGQLSKDNNGTGLGGQFFARAFTLTCPSIAAGLGQKERLYLVAGQSVQDARSESNGRVTFDDPLGAAGAWGAIGVKNDWDGPFGGTPIAMHSDIWDVHVDPNSCPPGKFNAWIANDGGVYQGVGAAGDGAIRSLTWSMAGLGLHTQNAHALALVKRPGQGAPLIFYATGDNDGWWTQLGANGQRSGTWVGGGTAGDANLAQTDGFTLRAYGARDYWPGGTCLGGQPTSPCGYLIDFSPNLVTGLDPGGLFKGLVSPTVFGFIQTLDSEINAGSAPDGLDAVMLVDLPLLTSDGGSVSTGPLGGTTAARRVIIRNPSFDDNPDGVKSNYAGWTIERDNVPAEAVRFWATGGHSGTRYYIYTPGSASCPQGLQMSLSNGGWRCVIEGLAFDNTTGVALGPVFVNPYTPDSIFAIVTTATPTPVSTDATPVTNAPAVLYSSSVSKNGTPRFCEFSTLGRLVSASGQFPLSGVDRGLFDPGSTFATLHGSWHGGATALIADVAFDRSNPSRVVVATPRNGVFYGELHKTLRHIPGHDCSEPVWHSLQKPTDNFGYIAGAAMMDGQVYLVTEGRGMFEISNAASGPLASYFDIERAVVNGAKIATLRDGSGAVVPWARYTLRMTEMMQNLPFYGGSNFCGQGVVQSFPGRTICSNELVNTVTGRTDAQGGVALAVRDNDFLPKPNPPRRIACELEFLGDGVRAPVKVRFDCSLN